jgi:hypothetical protein
LHNRALALWSWRLTAPRRPPTAINPDPALLSTGQWFIGSVGDRLGPVSPMGLGATSPAPPRCAGQGPSGLLGRFVCAGLTAAGGLLTASLVTTLMAAFSPRSAMLMRRGAARAAYWFSPQTPASSRWQAGSVLICDQEAQRPGGQATLWKRLADAPGCPRRPPKPAPGPPCGLYPPLLPNTSSSKHGDFFEGQEFIKFKPRHAV